MNSRRHAAVRAIIPTGGGTELEQAKAFAPVNIALVKYWGKRDEELNLPVTDSLSISLALGTETTIRRTTGQDGVILNGSSLSPTTSFYRRISAFLDLVRPYPTFAFSVHTTNSVPTSAGLASSASGFAALTLALNQLFGWNCSGQQLSLLARLGSGSACRSIYRGFVHWKRGDREDGGDSFALPIDRTWPDLCLGALILSDSPKPVGSTQAMHNAVTTSSTYSVWPRQVEEDLRTMRHAIETQNFSLLGQTAERNALAMHATMLTSWPPLCYWTQETIAAIQTVWRARREGLPLFFTMDAGPNPKLLFLREQTHAVLSLFPNLTIVPQLP